MSKQQYSRGTETVYMQRNRECIYAEEQRLYISRGTETVYMQRNRDCIYAEEQRLYICRGTEIERQYDTMALHQNVPTIVSAQVSRYIPYINSVLSNLMRNTI